MAKGPRRFGNLPDALIFGKDYLSCYVKVDEYKVDFLIDEKFLKVYEWTFPKDYFSVPKSMISNITIDKSKERMLVSVNCKDYRAFTVSNTSGPEMPNNLEINMQALQKLIVSEKDIWAFSYFSYNRAIEDTQRGWSKYDAIKEWERENICFLPKNGSSESGVKVTNKMLKKIGV
jgi:hypothetical protein